MKLSDRVSGIRPSPTLALNAKAKALAAEGVDVVAFTAGEPDFDTPEHVKKAAALAMARGATKYTQSAGIPELRAAVAEATRREVGGAWAAENVLVTSGAKQALYNLFQALLDPGDEVVVVSPYWVSYPDMVALAGGRAVFVETRAADGWTLDPSAVRRVLSPRTRAVVLNSPSNPSGAVLSRENLGLLGAVLRDHPDCVIVSDDIYDKLVYDGRSFASILHAAPDLADRTLVVNGCSKAWAMTGWRLGWAVGPTDVIRAMNLVQDQSTSNATSIAQYAALAAVTGPRDSLDAMRAEFELRRNGLVAALNAIPGVRCDTPGGAFYAFPDVRELCAQAWHGQPVATSARLAEILLADFRLAVVPGSAFGAEGHVRLSFATSVATIEKGVERLREFATAG